ncbi:MAG: agmatine deiminase family protein [Methanoregulaceae archaeon]
MTDETITIGLIQMEIRENRDENLRRAVGKTESAARHGAKIICLPELFRNRYFPQYIGRDVSACAESIPGESGDAFAMIAKRYGVVIIVPFFEKAPDGKFYNSAVVIGDDGTSSKAYRKVHIPQDPGFFEKEYFYPGSSYLVHDTPFGRIAVLICYDQWFPEAARSVALEGADIIFYPTAIGHPSEQVPVEGNWQEAWEIIQRSHAIASSIHVAAVNRVGREGGIRFFGGSFVCDAFGKILARAGDGEELVLAKIDLSQNRSVRDSWGFIRNRRPDTYGTLTLPFLKGAVPEVRPGDTPRNQGFHMPAEWELHDAVWISWPANDDTFPHLPDVEKSYVQFIAAMEGSERVELLVRDDETAARIRKMLESIGSSATQVTFRITDYFDVWIRDYGPTFVLNPALRQKALVRWRFNAWGGKYDDLLKDGEVPGRMNEWLGLQVFEPGIVLEGGSIEVNGRGTVLTTRSCLLNLNRNPGVDEGQIEKYLHEYLGTVKVIWLEDGIEGDDTDGHIDDLARFCDPTTVVCAYEENETDRNFAVLRRNYGILKNSTDQDGNPLTVIRLPMPRRVEAEGERYPASYTNFYIGNTVVIVPMFQDPADAEALRILRKLFPGRKVIGINARQMVEGFGTFHCASQQEPRSGTI